MFRPMCLWIFVVMCLMLAPAVYAQQDQGAITGRVTDTSGAAVPRASVTAVEIKTGVGTTTTAGLDGSYTLAPLKIGSYKVVAEMPGFKRSAAEGIELHAQSRVRVDLKLEVGPVAEEISVTAEVPLLDRESSSLGHLLDEREIKELPMNGRNFQSLAVLAGGVLPDFGHRDQQGGFNAHGQWAIQNNFILDGIDNNSQVLGLEDRKAQVLIPNLDAVREFKIQTSNYSAEFGRNAGAVMNVTIKSGTNAVHGTAYEYLRNNRFDARDAFDYADRNGDGRADTPKLDQHQFGLTLGGPIRRNRTFFFGAFEGFKVDSTNSVSVIVPTLLERQGIFDPAVSVLKDPANANQPFPNNTIPRDRWDPTAAKLMALFPEPNFKGSTRENYVSSPTNQTNRYQGDIRLDHSFSAEDKAFVRFSVLDFGNTHEGPIPAPGVGADDNQTGVIKNNAYSLAASETHMFGPHVANEVRFGWNRLVTDNQEISSGYPNEQYGLKVPFDASIEGLSRIVLVGPLSLVTLGEAPFSPLHKVSQTYQFLDNVLWVRGAHSLKAGADVRFIKSTVEGAPGPARGINNFNGKFTASTLGDFLLGWTNNIQYGTHSRGDLREQDYMFYVQDDWRVSPHLTLNLGLRYELASPMYDSQDRMATLDLSVWPTVKVVRAGERGSGWSSRGLIDTDTNNLAPRIGFAWQPGSRWTVRGAAGIFYGTSGGGLGAANRLINNWPVFRSVTITSTNAKPAGLLKDGIDASILGNETVMPAGLNWNVWPPSFSLPTITQWNFSVQRQMSANAVVTVSYVGSRSRYLARPTNLNSAPIGDPATERQRRPNPDLNSVTLRDPSGSAWYNGLETTIEKRFSRGFRFTLAHTWSHAIDDVNELFASDFDNISRNPYYLDLERGNAGFDRRHRVAGSWLWDLPFGKNPVVGGWKFTGIASWQTGKYFDVNVPNATSSLGLSSAYWRPDLVGSPYPANQSVDNWLDKNAFVTPKNADGTFRFQGNLGRNSLISPNYYNLDLGLMKGIAIKGDTRIQFRAEAFNVTNHPSYGPPSNGLQNPDFGKIRSTVSHPRQLQFAVKLVF